MKKYKPTSTSSKPILILRDLVEHPKGRLVADLIHVYGELVRTPRDYENNRQRQLRLSWAGDCLRRLERGGLARVASIDTTGYNNTPRNVWMITPAGEEFLKTFEEELRARRQTARDRVTQQEQRRVERRRVEDERKAQVETVRRRWEEQPAEARGIRSRNPIMAELKREGFSLREIGIVFDLTYQRVQQILKDQKDQSNG